MMQNQGNKFCQPMTLSVSHHMVHGGILLKASILPIAEPGKCLHLQLLGNIHGCYFSEREACTLDTVRTNLNSIWLL